MHNIQHGDTSKNQNTVVTTVTDWDSMGHVITQTRGRAYQTLGEAFQTLRRAFSFLLNPQKLGRVFQKLG